MIEVVAGLDESQVLATYDLHREWAQEEGRELDEEAWAIEMRGLCAGRRYNLWVAWDGPSPVGVTECHLNFDAMRHEWVCYGERAYVLPGYRQRGVFDKIVKAGIDIMGFLGIAKFRAPCGVDDAHLRGYYESLGFRPAVLTLEKVV